jgi:transcriptional regulator with XRE-family HTH domain
MARRPATTDEEVAKFRRDAERLTKTHLSGRIAEKLGVGSANFSSYVNGSKRPGKNILKKFYNLEEMQNTADNAQDTGDNKKRPDYEPGDLKTDDEDENGRYTVDLDDPDELRKELFRMQKMNNANAWAGLHEMIETNKIMAKGVDETAKGTTINARMMEKLLDKVLAIDGNSAAS